MEQNDPYNDQLNELLKKYLLEAEHNRLADEALDMHADFVFGEEPEVLPPPAREQELINKLNERAGITSGRRVKLWRDLMAAACLLILGISSVVLFAPKNESTDTAITAETAVPAEHDGFMKAPPAHDPAVTASDAQTVIMIPAPPEQIPLIETGPPVDNLQILASMPPEPTAPQGMDMRGLSRDLGRMLARYIHQLPAERMYVHTDRDVYQPGQDLFFALYLRNEHDLKASNLSEVVKVQLKDPKGKVVSALQIATREGLGQGSISLANGLPEGVYHLSAYTAWQQNVASELLFEREVILHEPETEVANGTEEVSYLPIMPRTQWQSEFYPEGGDMVAGLLGRVAYRLLMDEYDYYKGAGYVTNLRGEKVGLLKPDKNGLGWFDLTPEAGQTYTAHLVKGERSETFTLPRVQEKGITITLYDITKDNAEFIVSSTEDTKAILFAQVRGTIYYNKVVELHQGENNLSIPLKGFPAGTAQFTVFNAEGLPVAERLAFVNLHKQLNVAITTDKKQYGPREKVTMKVSVTDDKGAPVQGQFSLAVKDGDPLSQVAYGQGNILSKLLLEPDIDGLVEDGAQYLKLNDAVAGKNLDLLLMTRGWRKFSWDDLLKDKLPNLKYAPEKRVFSAIIVDELTGQPLKGAKVRVQGWKQEFFTDKDGRVALKNLDLTEPREIYLSYKVGIMTFVLNRYEENLVLPFIGDNRRVYQPQINNLFHPVVSGRMKLSPDSTAILGQVTDVFGNGVPYATLTATAGLRTVHTIADALGFYTMKLKDAGAYELKVFATGYQTRNSTVLVKAENVVLLDVQLSTGSPYAANKWARDKAQLYANSPDNRFSFITPNLRLVAAGDKNTLLEMAPDAEKEDLATFFSDMGTRPEEFSYYLDGLKVNRNEAQSMSMGRLKGIIAPQGGISARYSYGPILDMNSKGAVLGTGWMDDLSFASNDPGKPSQFNAVYHKAREFPKISYPLRDRPVKPVDFRTTLYWNGNITTDNNGQAVVEFYTSDDLTAFEAVVEGVSDKGMVGTGSGSFITVLPFGVQAEVPLVTEVTKRFKLPVTFYNTTGYQITGKLEVKLPPMLKTTDPLKLEHTIFPLIKDTLEFDVEVISDVPGDLEITFTANGYRTVFRMPMKVHRKKPE